MKKKALALLLSVATVVTMMGCGGQAAAPAAEAPAAEAPAEEAEAPKVSSMRFPRILIPSLCGTIRPIFDEMGVASQPWLPSVSLRWSLPTRTLCGP